MINIIDSRLIRTTSNAQDLLNDLAPVLKAKWENITVVYNETTPSSVDEIQLTEKVYLSLYGTQASNILFGHKALSYSTNKSVISNNCYKIIETDKAVMVHENSANSWNQCFVIGTTKNPDEGTESLGVAMMTNTTSAIAYTDGMIQNAAIAIPNNYENITQYNEQYVPFVSWYTKDIFPDVYRVLARKTTSIEKVLLNGTDYYYVGGGFAVKYTP